MTDAARSLAIFIDFENLALGFQGRRERFDMTRVLERLVEKGKIVAKRAYADWSRFSGYTYMLHEHAIELVEIPRRGQSGKNSADIRLCVDAMDLAYSKDHIDTFVVVSGDSDFSPLVSKLKELGKHVIGLGMTESTSDLLRDNCDEFIYYEDLGRNIEFNSQIDSSVPEPKRKVFGMLMDALFALRRENQGSIGSSMIKDTIKRKKPSFNETYHGYRSFSELLLDAQKQGLVELDVDKKSRTYVVTRFGTEMTAPAPARPKEDAVEAGAEELPLLGKRRSRRRRRGRGNGNGNGHGEERAPAANEAGRVRMSVPLPSGKNPPAQPTQPAEEEDEEFDILEETDPRLDRLEEMDDDEEAFDDEEDEAPPARPQPAAERPPQQAQPRPQPQQRPQPQGQGRPQGQPRPQPAPVRPTPPTNRPAPQPRPQPQPQPRRPEPAPRPTLRVVVPGELPPPEDDEIVFGGDEPRPAVKPRPQPPPAVEPTPEPAAQEEPVKKPAARKPASAKKPAPAKKPAASGRGRGKKKPTEAEPATTEPPAE